MSSDYSSKRISSLSCWSLATLCLLMNLTLALTTEAGVDHADCLPEGHNLREKDGQPCIWMKRTLKEKEIEGVCAKSNCRPPNYDRPFKGTGVMGRLRAKIKAACLHKASDKVGHRRAEFRDGVE